MSKYYLIIGNTNNHYHILDSLGSSQCIGSDLIYRQNDTQLVYRVKPASKVLYMASYIFTRRGDYKKTTAECNKLYDSLTAYYYVRITYEQLMSLRDNHDDVDLKKYLISEEQFLSEIKNSDAMKSILEMNTLTERKPRKEVVLEVAFTEDNWCYTTDHYDNTYLNEKTIKKVRIPLDINTDMVKNYITNQLGVDYKFNF